MDQTQFDQLIMRLDVLNKLLAVLATRLPGRPLVAQNIPNLLKTAGFDEEEILRILSCHYDEKAAKKILE